MKLNLNLKKKLPNKIKLKSLERKNTGDVSVDVEPNTLTNLTSDGDVKMVKKNQANSLFNCPFYLTKFVK